MAIPVRLKVFKGDVLVTSRDFERDIIKIGRLASSHLCLEDEKVSRIHSVIEVGADGSLSITDMGSIGGTHVNGKRVSKGRLTFGDEVLVGGTTLRLERPTEVAAPTPAASSEVPSSAPQAQAAPVPMVAPVEMMPRVRRVPSHKARGPLGVSLRFLWGEQNVGEFFVAPGARKGFSVGTAEGVDFVMGDARLGASRFEVLRTDGQGFTAGFTSRMKGGLTRKGETLDLQAVIESGLASHEGEAYALSLETEDFLWVDLGGVTLEVCFQPVPRRAAAPLGDSLDFTVVNIFLVTFFLAAFFVISAVNQGADEVSYADELSSNTSRIARLIVKPPEVKQNRLLQQLDARRLEQEIERDSSRPRPRDNLVTDRAVAPRPEPRLPSKSQRGGASGARELVRVSSVAGVPPTSSRGRAANSRAPWAKSAAPGPAPTGALACWGYAVGPRGTQLARPSDSSGTEESGGAPVGRRTTATGRRSSAGSRVRA